MRPLALVLILVGGLCTITPAAPRREGPSKELVVLQAKLHGEWTGQDPCAGDLTFRANGTYERTHQGPTGTNSAGTWKLKGDASSPTLVLTCKMSDDQADEGQVAELRIVRVDDEVLEYMQLGGPSAGKLARYARARE